jgi:hypothetical protein
VSHSGRVTFHRAGQLSTRRNRDAISPDAPPAATPLEPEEPSLPGFPLTVLTVTGWLARWPATSFPDRGSTKILSEGEESVSQKRRNYSPEYRAEAVKRVIESSRPVAQVARELGILE